MKQISINDEMVGDPKLLYASLDMKKIKKFELFRYKMKNGKIDYFDSDKEYKKINNENSN